MQYSHCGEYENCLSNNYRDPATFSYDPTQHHIVQQTAYNNRDLDSRNVTDHNSSSA
jgi:hypothetical protein